MGKRAGVYPRNKETMGKRAGVYPRNKDSFSLALACEKEPETLTSASGSMVNLWSLV